VATVVVTPTAEAGLLRLVQTHSLPRSTIERVKHVLKPLADLPELGRRLEGRWTGYRFVLGPWRWMIILYVYDVQADRVAIVTVQDGRSAGAPSTLQ
jgi:plasmid stabilization system protein ParE